MMLAEKLWKVWFALLRTDGPVGVPDGKPAEETGAFSTIFTPVSG